MARTPLIAGNWKMNVDHVAAVTLVQQLDAALSKAKHDHESVEVAVLPPFTDLRSVQVLVDGDSLSVRYGAQDVSAHDPGARTGEIAASFLARLGARYVTVGHSERRTHHHEDDATVSMKASAALAAGVTPIICVGEDLEVRKDHRQVEHVVGQVDGSLQALSAEQIAVSVIAYEPVWAIGTGEVATAADAQEVCSAIRERVIAVHGDSVGERLRILYGGSVKSSNVGELMEQIDVDGALVGGASLDAAEFAKIAGLGRS